VQLAAALPKLAELGVVRCEARKRARAVVSTNNVVGDIPTEVHNARPWQRGFSIAVVEYAREAAVVSKAW
jgi:hypothetical protein